MKIAGTSEIRTQLKELNPNELREIILRLGRYKLDNKGLLNYLLFGASSESDYLDEVKEEIRQQLQQTNTSSFYLAKKSIRKALKTANTHIKYTGKEYVIVELLLFYCSELLALPLDIKRSEVLSNLFDRQVVRIEKALAKLHEDLQYDYHKELQEVLREW
ncbi:MAG: hypothetical protein LCH37_11295 [Bacteroidetes bacterium]|nr:hypothetical protein [Bacteroidota bacterium]